MSEEVVLVERDGAIAVVLLNRPKQLNWWRDISWHETVGHARDWLALSMLGDEAQGAIRSFLDRSK